MTREYRYNLLHWVDMDSIDAEGLELLCRWYLPRYRVFKWFVLLLPAILVLVGIDLHAAEGIGEWFLLGYWVSCIVGWLVFLFWALKMRFNIRYWQRLLRQGVPHRTLFEQLVRVRAHASVGRLYRRGMRALREGLQANTYPACEVRELYAKLITMQEDRDLKLSRTRWGMGFMLFGGLLLFISLPAGIVCVVIGLFIAPGKHTRYGYNARPYIKWIESYYPEDAYLAEGAYKYAQGR